MLIDRTNAVSEMRTAHTNEIEFGNGEDLTRDLRNGEANFC